MVLVVVLKRVVRVDYLSSSGQAREVSWCAKPVT